MTRFALLLSLAASLSFAQATEPPAKSISDAFQDVNRKLLAMAKDFPESKYGYRATKDVRSFGEVIVHLAAANTYVAHAGRGENVKWEEGDPKPYTTKASIVALFEKNLADADATLKATPPDRFTKNIQPWLAVIEHAGEHYGQLVVYYRNNGIVPPESRPKK